MADRKTSPLADDEDTPPWGDTPQPQPAREGSDQRKQPAEGPPQQRSANRFPNTSRRKRSTQPLDPFDKVSFNANLPLVLRRVARTTAARWECDVQDVLATALLDLFEREGIPVPTTREEYDQLVTDGKL